MNFVKLYIGDYLRDTGTLTVAEHGAYVLMLLHHYATETGLPQGKELHRLLRAETKADREAIDSVCARFWYAGADGKLFNKRADMEILKAEHQRDVNRSVGKLGGRPKRDESESKPNRLAVGTEAEENHNPNQTPDTSKDISTASQSHPPAGGLAAGFADFWLAWPKGERKQDKAKCLEHWKRNLLHLKADAILADVRVKRATQKWSEGFVEAPLVYLRGKRWEDGVEPEAPRLAAGALTVPRDPAADAAAAARLLEDRAHAALAFSPQAAAARAAAVARLLPRKEAA